MEGREWRRGGAGRQAGNYLRNAILRKDGEHSTAQHSRGKHLRVVRCHVRVVLWHDVMMS